jgi:oligopeptide/dipeptide ABC transporter ATP-binding protein
MTQHLLEVEHLSVDYGTTHPVHAVRDVSLTVEPDAFVGLVGESGCGKSTLGMSIARLERPPAHIVGGQIRIAGQDWTQLSGEELRRARWSEVAVVLQSGMNALNPIMTIGAQFRDVMQQHTRMTRSEIDARAAEMVQMVQIDPAVLSRYPHELSGGMKQRIAIALALVLHPKLVIMDEPTTALDMVVQRQILDNLRELRRQQLFAMLFISHDLGLVMELCDRVAVMYAGEIVENEASARMLERPLHPYTRALLQALPNPETPTGTYSGIPGAPPDLHDIPNQCMFAPRCPLVEPRCLAQTPPLERFDDGDIELRCFVTREEVSHAVSSRA